jgi:hypothetical protein
VVQIYSFFHYLQELFEVFYKFTLPLFMIIMLIDFKNLNLNQLPPKTEFEKKVKAFLEVIERIKRNRHEITCEAKSLISPRYKNTVPN